MRKNIGYVFIVFAVLFTNKSYCQMNSDYIKLGCQVYGLGKYYSGISNNSWDSVFLKAVSAHLKAQDNNECNNALASWLSPIKTSACYKDLIGNKDPYIEKVKDLIKDRTL